MKYTPKTPNEWSDLMMTALTDIMAATKDLNIAAHYSKDGFIIVVTDKTHRTVLPHAAAELMIQPKESEKEKCHWCEEPTDCKDYVQAFTGRVFCSRECWQGYKKSEGLE